MKKFKRNITILLVAFIATFFMFQNAYAYEGIDVSTHNGYINYNQVVQDGVKAVIIKATEGVDFQDSMINANYQRATSAGVQHIGFYHFMSEKTDPSDQARDFWEVIKDKNYDIMPCLDIETNSYNRSSFEITNRCLEFIQTFKSLSGQNVMIYSGAYFARDNLDFRLKTQPLWVAHYGVSTPMTTGFANVVGHQYTETGSINGVNGYCDVNNFSDGMLLENSNYIPNIPTVVQSQEVISNISGNTKVLELQRIINHMFPDAQISEDNIWGSQTSYWTHKLLAGIPYHTPELTIWIQSRLGLEPDGIYYTETAKNVGWYQYRRGLKSDKLAGYNTIKELALE